MIKQQKQSESESKVSRQQQNGFLEEMLYAHEDSEEQQARKNRQFTFKKMHQGRNFIASQNKTNGPHISTAPDPATKPTVVRALKYGSAQYINNPYVKHRGQEMDSQQMSSSVQSRDNLIDEPTRVSVSKESIKRHFIEKSNNNDYNQQRFQLYGSLEGGEVSSKLSDQNYEKGLEQGHQFQQEYRNNEMQSQKRDNSMPSNHNSNTKRDGSNSAFSKTKHKVLVIDQHTSQHNQSKQSTLEAKTDIIPNNSNSNSSRHISGKQLKKIQSQNPLINKLEQQKFPIIDQNGHHSNNHSHYSQYTTQTNTTNTTTGRTVRPKRQHQQPHSQTSPLNTNNNAAAANVYKQHAHPHDKWAHIPLIQSKKVDDNNVYANSSFNITKQAHRTPTQSSSRQPLRFNNSGKKLQIKHQQSIVWNGSINENEQNKNNADNGSNRQNENFNENEDEKIVRQEPFDPQQQKPMQQQEFQRGPVPIPMPVQLRNQIRNHIDNMNQQSQQQFQRISFKQQPRSEQSYSSSLSPPLSSGTPCQLRNSSSHRIVRQPSPQWQSHSLLQSSAAAYRSQQTLTFNNNNSSNEPQFMQTNNIQQLSHQQQPYHQLSHIPSHRALGRLHQQYTKEHSQPHVLHLHHQPNSSHHQPLTPQLSNNQHQHHHYQQHHHQPYHQPYHQQQHHQQQHHQQPNNIFNPSFAAARPRSLSENDLQMGRSRLERPLLLTPTSSNNSPPHGRITFNNVDITAKINQNRLAMGIASVGDSIGNRKHQPQPQHQQQKGQYVQPQPQHLHPHYQSFPPRQQLQPSLQEQVLNQAALLNQNQQTIAQMERAIRELLHQRGQVYGQVVINNNNDNFRHHQADVNRNIHQHHSQPQQNKHIKASHTYLIEKNSNYVGVAADIANNNGQNDLNRNDQDGENCDLPVYEKQMSYDNNNNVKGKNGSAILNHQNKDSAQPLPSQSPSQRLPSQYVSDLQNRVLILQHEKKELVKKIHWLNDVISRIAGDNDSSREIANETNVQTGADVEQNCKEKENLSKSNRQANNQPEFITTNKQNQLNQLTQPGNTVHNTTITTIPHNNNNTMISSQQADFSSQVQSQSNQPPTDPQPLNHSRSQPSHYEHLYRQSLRNTQTMLKQYEQIQHEYQKQFGLLMNELHKYKKTSAQKQQRERVEDGRVGYPHHDNHSNQYLSGYDQLRHYDRVRQHIDKCQYRQQQRLRQQQQHHAVALFEDKIIYYLKSENDRLRDKYRNLKIRYKSLVQLPTASHASLSANRGSHLSGSHLSGSHFSHFPITREHPLRYPTDHHYHQQDHQYDSIYFNHPRLDNLLEQTPKETLQLIRQIFDKLAVERRNLGGEERTSSHHGNYQQHFPYSFGVGAEKATDSVNANNKAPTNDKHNMIISNKIMKSHNSQLAGSGVSGTDIGDEQLRLLMGRQSKQRQQQKIRVTNQKQQQNHLLNRSSSMSSMKKSKRGEGRKGNNHNIPYSKSDSRFRFSKNGKDVNTSAAHQRRPSNARSSSEDVIAVGQGSKYEFVAHEQQHDEPPLMSRYNNFMYGLKSKYGLGASTLIGAPETNASQQ